MKQINDTIHLMPLSPTNNSKKMSSKTFSCHLCIVLLFFTFCIGVYYCKSSMTSNYVIVNINNSIADALERIPICNLNDRSRQQVLLTTLYAWTQFAHEHNIQYWIAYGSLVGYMQRGGLLPHDGDTDILMLAQDTQYLVPFADKNFSLIYELKVHPKWSFVGYAKRSYYPKQGFNFIAPNARFVHRKLRYHVDIWPIYDFNPNQSRKKTNVTTTLTEYDASYRWITSPVEWTFPLQPCNFSNILVWCPAKPENIVTKLYGKGSLTKTNKKCVNKTWVSA